MAWGKSWDLPKIEIVPPSKPQNEFWSNGGIVHEEMTKEEFKIKYPSHQYGKFNAELRDYNNLKPTHDPYANPNAQIYYECSCGAILDPGTKSFAALNNYASEKGWKIRFGHNSYVPYCVKCGEDIE